MTKRIKKDTKGRFDTEHTIGGAASDLNINPQTSNPGGTLIILPTISSGRQEDKRAKFQPLKSQNLKTLLAVLITVEGLANSIRGAGGSQMSV